MKTLILLFALISANVSFSLSTNGNAIVNKGKKTQVHYNKVVWNEKKQSLLYEYTITEDKASIEFVLKGKQVTADFKMNGQFAGQLKADGKNIFFRLGPKIKWLRISESWKNMLAWQRAMILNHPIILGDKELSKMFPKSVVVNAVGIVGLEHSLIDAFSDDDGGLSSTYTSPGTVSQSCSCGTKTVTVTCSTGCGVACQGDTRRSCRITDDGQETDCRDVEVCIGLCLCGQ